MLEGGEVYRRRRKVYMASWVESLLHFNAHMNEDGMALHGRSSGFGLMIMLRSSSTHFNNNLMLIFFRVLDLKRFAL